MAQEFSRFLFSFSSILGRISMLDEGSTVEINWSAGVAS